MCHKNNWPLRCLPQSESPSTIAYVQTFVSLLSRHRSDISCVAWSYRYWQLTRSPCVFASYPQQKTRAFGMSAGRISRSQCVPFAAVHVLSRCPFKPWTATMLASISAGSCNATDGLLNNRLLSLRHDLETLGRCLRGFLRLRWGASLLQRQPDRGTEFGLTYIVFAIASEDIQSPQFR